MPFARPIATALIAASGAGYRPFVSASVRDRACRSAKARAGAKCVAARSTTVAPPLGLRLGSRPAWSIAARSSTAGWTTSSMTPRSEEHTSELQSLTNLVCRLLLSRLCARSLVFPYTTLFRSLRFRERPRPRLSQREGSRRREVRSRSFDDRRAASWLAFGVAARVVDRRPEQHGRVDHFIDDPEIGRAHV